MAECVNVGWPRRHVIVSVLRYCAVARDNVAEHDNVGRPRYPILTLTWPDHDNAFDHVIVGDSMLSRLPTNAYITWFWYRNNCQ